MDYLIREMSPREYPLLADFLYEAIFIPEGAEKPPRGIIEQEELQVYIKDFGERASDFCLVAEVGSKAVGACWVRIMDDYGHIDNETPSFAISLYEEYRGHGIGTKLMRRMLTLLKLNGYKRASLAVQKENYAVKMYKKVGFKIVGENEQEFIMLCELQIEEKMSYAEDFKRVIFGFAKDVERYLSGDKADYVYRAEKDRERGTFDKNYSNRSRLCWALEYDVCEVPDKFGLVRELFLEELKDRETNSFQGIGENLETLTSLLLQLGEPKDSELFVRAKNANFDCACGYEPRIIKATPFEELPRRYCIETLFELGEEELAIKLTDEFKSEAATYEDFKDILSVSKWATHREVDLRSFGDREFAVTGIYELYQKSPESFDKFDAFSAANDYAELLIEKGDIAAALDVFNKNRETLKKFGRGFYKLGAKLISGSAENPEKIWAEILPHIKEDLKHNMVAPIYRDVMLSAAELSGDRDMLKELERYFKKREQEKL